MRNDPGMMPKARCKRCGSELSYSNDLCTHLVLVQPCTNCINQAEARVVKASAEDIQSARIEASKSRDELRLHQSEQWKEGYKAGFKDGFTAGEEVPE